MKYEYMVRKFYDRTRQFDDMSYELNKLGEAGWELVGIMQFNNDSWNFIFKRIK